MEPPHGKLFTLLQASSFLSWYNRLLDEYPFETNAYSNALIGAFADVLRQFIEYYFALRSISAQEITSRPPGVFDKMIRTKADGLHGGFLEKNSAVKVVLVLAMYRIRKIFGLMSFLARGFANRFTLRTVLEQYLLGFAVVHPICNFFFAKLEEWLEDEDEEEEEVVTGEEQGITGEEQGITGEQQEVVADDRRRKSSSAEEESVVVRFREGEPALSLGDVEVSDGTTPPRSPVLLARSLSSPVRGGPAASRARGDAQSSIPRSPVLLAEERFFSRRTLGQFKRAVRGWLGLGRSEQADPNHPLRHTHASSPAFLPTAQQQFLARSSVWRPMPKAARTFLSFFGGRSESGGLYGAARRNELSWAGVVGGEQVQQVQHHTFPLRRHLSDDGSTHTYGISGGSVYASEEVVSRQKNVQIVQSQVMNVPPFDKEKPIWPATTTLTPSLRKGLDTLQFDLPTPVPEEEPGTFTPASSVRMVAQQPEITTSVVQTTGTEVEDRGKESEKPPSSPAVAAKPSSAISTRTSGGASAPPIRWQPSLPTTLSTFPDFSQPAAREFLNAVKKVLAEELLFAPFFNFIFLHCESVLAGLTLKEAFKEFRSKFVSLQITNFAFWFPVNLGNFYLVPAEKRLLFVNLMNVIWMVYLSLKAKKL